jgi:cytochrome c2
MRLKNALGMALLLTVPCAVALFYSSPTVYAATAPNGKAVFQAQKCNLCHSVQAAGIEAMTKSDKMKGPELGAALAKKDAAWIEKYVRKQVDLDGKKHPKEWKGSEAELAALIDWLKSPKK